MPLPLLWIHSRLNPFFLYWIDTQVVPIECSSISLIIYFLVITVTTEKFSKYSLSMNLSLALAPFDCCCYLPFQLYFVALVGGAALGFTSPTLGCLAHKYSLSKFITCWLFFLSGKCLYVLLYGFEFWARLTNLLLGLLGLKSQDGDVKEVVEAWPAVLYGLVWSQFSECILYVESSYPLDLLFTIQIWYLIMLDFCYMISLCE